MFIKLFKDLFEFNCMKIFIVRHGKTNENEQNRLSGHSNRAKLTKVGMEHAERITEIFKNEKIDALYSSPIYRAIETAYPIAEALGMKIKKNDLLKEFDFGDDDGKVIEGKALKHLEKRNIDLDFHFPGGESMNELIDRSRKFVEDLRLKGYNKVLIIAHHRINTALISEILGIASDDSDNIMCIGQENPIIYEIDSIAKSCKWFNSLTGESGKGIIYEDILKE